MGLVGLAGGLLLSFWYGRYFADQILHHVPTVIGIAWLFRVRSRGSLTVASQWACILFLALHILGARYIYSNVPYEQWLESAFGFSVREQLGWQRNHYDRLVHFAFGVLFAFPLNELARRRAGLSPALAAAASVLGVLALSAVYEIIEWGLTWFVQPVHAERYNGQQGDFWDAQKDMALAWLGVTLAEIARWAIQRIRRAPPRGR